MKSCYVQALGAVTAAGVGVDGIFESMLASKGTRERNLQNFKPAKYLSQKKMMKTISHRDAVGLAALEQLRPSAERWQQIPATRRGMMLSAAAAFCRDLENYSEAQEEAGDDLVVFGQEAMRAQPNTLLQGLPNNVLCYGSMILDCQGINNNFTCLDTGVYVALHRALRALRARQSDMLVVGGYTGHCDPVNHRMFADMGMQSDQFADGAVFAALSDHPEDLRLVDVNLAHAPFEQMHPERALTETLQECTQRTLSRAGIGVEDVGVIWLHQPGIPLVDKAERAAAECWTDSSSVIASLAPFTGNLLEAGGLLEPGFNAWAARHDVDLKPFSLNATSWDQSKPYILSTRTTLFGDIAVALFKYEGAT